MPGLLPGIHVLGRIRKKVVDGRVIGERKLGYHQDVHSLWQKFALTGAPRKRPLEVIRIGPQSPHHDRAWSITIMHNQRDMRNSWAVIPVCEPAAPPHTARGSKASFIMPCHISA
jgi:hypothetical protein